MITEPMREARQAAGLTAIRLAELAASTEQRVFQIERRRYRPKRDEARRIATVLDLPIRKLFPDGVQED